MMTSRPFGKTWLISFASGSRGAGVVVAGFGAAGLVAVGRDVRCCGTSASSVEGDSKQRRSKRIEKRFTDNSRFRKIVLVFDSSGRQIDVAV